MGDRPQEEDASDEHAWPQAGRRAAQRRTPSPRRHPGDPLFVGVGSICDTAARLAGVDGAAVAVLAASRNVRELVYATDAIAQQVDELQFVLGQGPCLDAYRQQRPQMYARITEAFELPWPAFASEAAALGVAAVFAYPIAGPRQPLGVLELYRRTAGNLSEQEQQSTQVCATALQRTIEGNWNEALTRGPSAAEALDAIAVQVPVESDPFTRHQVYVAAGMVAVQLKISTTDALDRLRAYAFGNQRSVLSVAADIATRRLSFAEADDGGSADQP